ncbi:putative gustatory receptor 2a [Aedes albopictus]|uniref:Gustatory receptor n=1 Tax=Aedes albopictus TaxID=7160 RepID=A0ABM1ZQ53_AEDAL
MTVALTIIGIILHSQVFHAHSFVGHVNDIMKFSIGLFTVLVALVSRIIYNKPLSKVWTYFAKHTSNGLIRCSPAIRKYCIKFWIYHIVTILIEYHVIHGIGFSHQWVYFWLSNIYPSTICREIHLCHILYTDYLNEQLEELLSKLLSIKKLMEELMESRKKDSEYQSKLEEYISNLFICKKQYSEIWSVMRTVNKLFAWTQVLNIANNFIQFSCDFYWTYMHFSRLKKTPGIFALFLCLIPAPMILMMLLTAAERFRSLGARIGSILHEIPKTNNRELYDTVYSFSMQVEQQPMQLLAYNLMKIDYSLTIRIVAGVTSYMVIFIQLSK